MTKKQIKTANDTIRTVTEQHIKIEAEFGEHSPQEVCQREIVLTTISLLNELFPGHIDYSSKINGFPSFK